VYRLPSGPASLDREKSAGCTKRDGYRRRVQMLVPLIVTIPGMLGLALLMPTMGIKLLPENEAIMTGGHSYNMVLPLMMSRYLGPTTRTRRDRHDRRVHVGHGRQRERVRYGLDLRRIPPPDQSSCQ